MPFPDLSCATEGAFGAICAAGGLAGSGMRGALLSVSCGRYRIAGRSLLGSRGAPSG
jgi:hypothetical protein